MRRTVLFIGLVSIWYSDFSVIPLHKFCMNIWILVSSTFLMSPKRIEILRKIFREYFYMSLLFLYCSLDFSQYANVNLFKVELQLHFSVSWWRCHSLSEWLKQTSSVLECKHSPNFRCPCWTLQEEHTKKWRRCCILSFGTQPALVNLDSHYHYALLRFTDAFSLTLLGCHLHNFVQWLFLCTFFLICTKKYVFSNNLVHECNVSFLWPPNGLVHHRGFTYRYLKTLRYTCV